MQSYPGDTDAVGQLIVGRADAVLTQDTSGAYQKKQNPNKLAIAYLFPETDSFGIYYRKGEAKLGTALKATIKTLEERHVEEDRYEASDPGYRREVGR